MAGIYIPGMEMPVGHNESSFGIDADGHPLLAVYTEKNKEPEIYYIIPVPDHGRLIDADTLADRLEKDRTFILHAMMEAHKKSDGYTREDYLFDRNGDFISILRNQAAVIPADKKEEK